MAEGQLAQCKVHEAEATWPASIEIIAWYGEGRQRRKKSVVISADQFFGRGQYGAPLSGDQLIGMIDRLRRRR